MSTILDALRRSERERHRDQAPTMRSIHAQFHQGNRQAVPIRLIAVVSLVIAGAGVGIGIWLGKTGRLSGVTAEAPASTVATPSAVPDAAPNGRASQPVAPVAAVASAAIEQQRQMPAASMVAAAPPVAPEAKPAKTAEPAEWESVNPDPAGPVASQVSAAPLDASVVTSDAGTPAPYVADAQPQTELLEVWQLSEAEQRFLQSLKVSLHVYSTDPAQRTVIINGLRTREGQPLGQDLSLLEITSDGIIVSFQQQRVHLQTIEH